MLTAIKNIKFWLIQKVEKSHNKKFEIGNFENLRCAVKFRVENLEHLCRELIKKYGSGWMGGWMSGRARFRIAYSNQKLVCFKNYQHLTIKFKESCLLLSSYSTMVFAFQF